MRRILGTLIAVLITQIGFSQDYKSDFQKYCQTNDTSNQLKVLTEWNSANQKDAELYTRCPLYTSDAADDLLCVELGGRRITKKKKFFVHHCPSASFSSRFLISWCRSPFFTFLPLSPVLSLALCHV